MWELWLNIVNIIAFIFIMSDINLLLARVQDNARPDVGVKQRLESPIIGLKNFNNWVKSVLITRFAHPALVSSPSSNHQFSGADRRGGGGASGKVLDMGCGKGGDLSKWSKARIKEYMGVGV